MEPVIAAEEGPSGVDPLTGARGRAAGLDDIDHELSRCRRTGARLVVAYVDVLQFKALSDARGSAAGDEVLVRVVAQIRSRLRPYDLVIRLGSDEFLCAMSNMSLSTARRRFAAIRATPDADAISVGFAALRTDESTAELVARADSELTGQGSSNRARRPSTTTSP